MSLWLFSKIKPMRHHNFAAPTKKLKNWNWKLKKKKTEKIGWQLVNFFDHQSLPPPPGIFFSLLVLFGNTKKQKAGSALRFSPPKNKIKNKERKRLPFCELVRYKTNGLRWYCQFFGRIFSWSDSKRVLRLISWASRRLNLLTRRTSYPPNLISSFFPVPHTLALGWWCSQSGRICSVLREKKERKNRSRRRKFCRYKWVLNVFVLQFLDSRISGWLRRGFFLSIFSRREVGYGKPIHLSSPPGEWAGGGGGKQQWLKEDRIFIFIF